MFLIEEKDKNSVMLESFLESIKALTEVNFEEDNKDEKEFYLKRRGYVDNNADESNKKILDNFENTQKTKDLAGHYAAPSGDKPVNKKSGLFSRITSKLKRFFKSIRE